MNEPSNPNGDSPQPTTAPGAVRATLEEALAMAMDFHKRHDWDRAAYIYRTILEAIPEQVEALNFLGVLLHQSGQNDEGARLIEKAIAVQPEYVDAISNLGNIRRWQGKFAEAESCYRRALELRPEHVDSLNNLGVVLKNQRNFSEAASVLTRAIELKPDRGDFHFNLGNVLEQVGRREEASLEFRQAIALMPNLKDAYDALGRSLTRQGRVREAIDVYRELLQHAPNNAVAEHMIAALGGNPTPSRASDGYVAATFDGFAATFDSILNHLDYQGPELVIRSLAASGLVPSASLDVLDAGCGTGLCGPKLRPFARQLIGIDLSQKMLEKARQREIYDELIQGELTAYLREHPETADIIVSSDTLNYFGDLRDVLVAAWNTLRAPGHLTFTLEDSGEQAGGAGYRLETHGRFSHREAYVRHILEEVGFGECRIERNQLRFESNEPVTGLIIYARKVAEPA